MMALTRIWVSNPVLRRSEVKFVIMSSVFLHACDKHAA
jgi:hypothetical protein